MEKLIVKTLSSLKGKVIKYEHRYYLVGGFKIVNCGGFLAGRTIVIFTNKRSIILDIKGFDSFNSSFNIVENYNFKTKEINHGVPIKSDYKGVYWDGRSLNWRAKLWLHGKQKHIGYYNCEHEAYVAILKYKKEYNLIKK